MTYCYMLLQCVLKYREMPVNRDAIGTIGWRNSLRHESKSTLIQLADIKYSDKDNYTKNELIEIYYKKLCAEGNCI